jgi:molecular chaperone GrpE (heat shock protein)
MQENTMLKANLAEAEEDKMKTTARLQEEKSRSEQLSSRLAELEAAHEQDTAKYNSVIAELRNYEQQLADIRSMPWWRRMRI